MYPCAHLKIPSTKEGTTLRAFIEGQAARNGDLMKDCFSEDAIFNGLMYQEKSGKEILNLYKSFLPEFLTSFRVEAIAPTGTGQWIVLEFVTVKGGNKEIAVCDLLMLDQNGKIKRIDNCFDVGKVSQDVKEDANGAAAAKSQ